MESDPAGAGAESNDQLPSRDEKAALEAAGGDAGLARELMETLLRGLPTELATLRVCHQADDWPELAQTAHRMRGATSYCGVPALDRLLRDLENACKRRDRDAITGLLSHINQEAARLREHFSL